MTTEPTSFAEIYRLSNINRKRNKVRVYDSSPNVQEKKKQRDDAAAEEGNESDEGDGAEAPARDADAFMQSIGWVTAGDSQANLGTMHAQQTGPSALTQVSPYDYTAAPSLPGICARAWLRQQAAATWNPGNRTRHTMR